MERDQLITKLCDFVEPCNSTVRSPLEKFIRLLERSYRSRAFYMPVTAVEALVLHSLGVTVSLSDQDQSGALYTLDAAFNKNEWPCKILIAKPA